MTSRDFQVALLSGDHDRSTFSCGNAALDRYLREQAGQDLRRSLSTIFVLLDTTSGAIAGFYTLSACQIEQSALPRDLGKRLPRRPVPATLIGRLAVDLRYRRRGLGESLLANALIRAAEASREVGAMLVVVDAKDDTARAFYEHFGFQRFDDDPYRLFIPMADAAHGARKE